MIQILKYMYLTVYHWQKDSRQWNLCNLKSTALLRREARESPYNDTVSWML